MQIINEKKEKNLSALKLNKNIEKNFKKLQTHKDIEKILQARFKDFSFSTLSEIPHFLELKDSVSAAREVINSLFANEKILIAGDYDSDGVCATCIMMDFFDLIEYKNVVATMPNRFKHGYGFSKKLLYEMLEAHSDIKLIITVDNGISSFEAGKICKDMGIKFIITDHHTIEKNDTGEDKIPPCDFLVNPMQQDCNFPFKEICGSLVAWYFCNAIKSELIKFLNEKLQNDILASSTRAKITRKLEILNKINMKSLLPLVGIATISDVMNLNELNHTICKYAIKNFYNFQKPAFEVIKSLFKESINSQSFGFKLAPLLNSAGRLSDGTIALNFLRSKSIKEARDNFMKLKNLNNNRKNIQEDVCKRANIFAKENNKNPFMMLGLGEDWHEGVLGIAAGRMADEFNKPAFVLTKIENFYKGSGRSVGNIDLIGSLQQIGHLFRRYGGHAGAVGLEIEECNINKFLSEFKPKIIENFDNENSLIIGEINPEIIDLELLDLIQRFEPYGCGNQRPTFYAKMKIYDIKVTSGGFTQFRFLKNDGFLKAMYFNKNYNKSDFRDEIEISFSVALDYFNSNREAMIIIDKIY